MGCMMTNQLRQSKYYEPDASKVRAVLMAVAFSSAGNHLEEH